MEEGSPPALAEGRLQPYQSEDVYSSPKLSARPAPAPMNQPYHTKYYSTSSSRTFTRLSLTDLLELNQFEAGGAFSTISRLVVEFHLI